LPGVVALGLLLLQLVTALHFALIPHGFNAGLSGFEHLHREQVRGVTESAPNRASVVTGARACAPDACPVAFCGLVSVLLARSAAVARIALPAPSPRVASAPFAPGRAQLLLAAPKTSPPRCA
jgi:hypothetical protein